MDKDPGWAVCPRVERNDASRSPKFFQSHRAASRFLNSESNFGSLEREAQLTGVTLEEAKERRSRQRTEFKKQRKEG